ncbi:MAG: LCP family protein [Actinomycetota bacterium]|nr:LCP family protein [Actinomycetota bacterium]
MAGSAPNEEGLRALGRTIDEAPRRGRAGPAHARRDRWVAGTSPGGGGGGTNGGGPGGGGGGRGKPQRPHKRRWVKRTLLITLAVLVIAVGAAAGYGWYLNHKIHRIIVQGLTTGATTGKDANTENILMVGSTTRCGLAHQTAAYGLCTQGVTGVNSDVIMILHLDPATKSVSILSLPRDLFIPNARSTGAYKIDAALAQGPSQLVNAIEEDFAIPIQHYVELNFDTFAAIVTQLGGITMEFPDPIFDRYSGLRVLTPGCHHLNGVQALQVVRARHLQYWVPGQPRTYPYTWPQEAESDLARITRDHTFLKVLASKMAKTGLGNPAHDISLIDALAPHLTVDSGFNASDMVHLVLTFHSVNVNQAPTMTLPVIVDTFGTYLYQGGHFGDVEFPSNPVDHSTIDSFLGLGAADNTMTGEPLPKAKTVTVSVLNGTGVTGQATQTATALGNLGFHTVGTGNATPVGQYSETTVSYAHRTPADIAAAQLVADSLSGAVILEYGPTADGAQVTVTTGSDFSVNSSLPSDTTPSAPTSTTPTTTTPPPKTSGNVTYGATVASRSTSPTSGFTGTFPAVTPLTSYDPRACPPGVVGNPGNW